MPISVATTRVALRTTTGPQTITIPGFGTPKAALLLLNQASSDGVATDSDVLALGLTDGVRHWAGCLLNLHGGTSSFTYKVQSFTDCLYKMDGVTGAEEVLAAWSAWVTDGVQLNVTLAPATAYLLTVVLFGGSDLTAYVNSVTTASTVGGSVSTTAPGFAFDDLLMVSLRTTGSTTTGYAISLGLCHHDSSVLTSRSLGWGRLHNVSPTQSGAGVHTTYVMYLSTGATVQGHEITARSATGFSVTTRLVTGASAAAYLALAYGGAAQSWVGTVTTPTAPGAQSYTGPGFPPQAVLLAQSLVPTVNVHTLDATAGTAALSIVTPTAQYCLAQSSVDNVTTTDTQSLHDDVALVVPQETGSAGLAATLTSVDATGWTLNYSAVLGTARQGWAWAIEGAAPPRTLTAALGTVTSTPAVAISLVTTRPLTAALSPVTTTPASAVTQARALTATLSPATTTPASAVTQGRTVTAALASATSTPAVTILLVTTRPLTAALTPVTTTPASPALQARALTTTLPLVTTTPDTVATQARRLTAVLLSDTTTPASPGVATLPRELTAALSSSTTTPAALGELLIALAHDAVSESHPGTTGSTSAPAFSWPHTPGGTPRGVLCFTFTNATADDALGVTYDGVALTAIPSGRAVDTAGEAGDCKAWFLGSAVPTTSPATVEVSRNNTANVMYAVCVTLSASGDMEVKGPPVLVQGDGTLAELSVDAGVDVEAVRYAGINSGLASVVDNPAAPGANSLSRGANSTALADIDFGARVIQVVRETTSGPGSRPVGFSATTSDDRAAVYVAIGEAVVVGETRSLTATLLSVTTTLDSAATQDHALTAMLLTATSTPVSPALQAHALTASLVSDTSTPPSAVTLATLRSLTATLLSATTTPTSAVTQGRSLVAGLVTATTTPTSGVTHGRSLTAQLSPATATPASAVLQARAVSSSLLGATSTPPAACSLARLIALVAALETTTSTPASPVTQTRPLTAALSPATTTPASPHTLTRGLTATLPAVTTTPDLSIALAGRRQVVAALSVSTTTPFSPATTQRALTSSLLGTTVTPDSAASIARAVLAALTTTTATPSSATTLARALIAQPLGSTTTPSAAPPTVQRRLMAGLVGATTTPLVTIAVTGQVAFETALLVQTSTPAPTIQIAQALTAALQGATTTPDSAQVLRRHLTAQPTASTATPTILPTVSRALLAAPATTTTTPLTAQTLQRALTALVPAASTTPNALIALPGIRSLTALLLSSTSTPPTGATVRRPLTAALLGSSSTPTALQVQQQALTALIVGSTTTPAAPTATTVRAVVATLPSATTTPPGTGRMRRELTATLLHLTATPAVALAPLARALTASPLLATFTPPVLTVETVRPLTAGLLSATMSPTAPIIVQGQVLLFAGLLTATTTPDAAVRQARALATLLLVTSTTLAADLTPGTWGEVLRLPDPTRAGRLTLSVSAPGAPGIRAPPAPGQLTLSLSAPRATISRSVSPPDAMDQGTLSPILRPAKAA